MIIGVPTETLTAEYRVGLLPENVQQLVELDQQVIVQSGAGEGVLATDADYLRAGAIVVPDAPAVFQQAELIVKVKEPLPSEYAFLQSHHTLFTFLHLAANRVLTQALVDSGCTAIGYETITDGEGRLPILQPMSAIAGRLAIQVGAHCLEKYVGGRGVLLGGVLGSLPGKVVVIGAGVAGTEAIALALGYGADVVVCEANPQRVAELNNTYAGRIQVHSVDEAILFEQVTNADVVVGAALIPGAKAPQLLPASWLPEMKPASVLVDVAIDQGGCFSTSTPTTHENPTRLVDGVLHYAVTNMPGAVPLTATQALTQKTMPLIMAMATAGVTSVLRQNSHLAAGVNVCQQAVTHAAVAQAHDAAYVAIDSFLT